MLKPEPFKLLITHTIIRLGMYSPAAVNLLLGTAAHESHLGALGLRQLGGGPARGVFQIEPATEEDIWENYLAYRPELTSRVITITGAASHDLHHLQYNLIYGITMARLHYWRAWEPLPSYDDIPALACYWDRHYNRNPNKGFSCEFATNYIFYIK